MEDSGKAQAELVDAVDSGNLLAFSSRVRYANLSAIDDDGATLLHIAARHGHRGLTLRLLLGDRLPSNVKDRHNQTPAQVAVLSGYPDMITLFQKLPLGILSMRQRSQRGESTPMEALFKAPQTRLRLSSKSPSERLQARGPHPVRQRAISTPIQRSTPPQDTDYPVITHQLMRLNVWSEVELMRLREKYAHFHRTVASEGDYIFSEGDSSNAGVFIALSGKFEVIKNELTSKTAPSPVQKSQHVLGKFTAPALFGDMGVIYQAARHYSMRALCDSVLVRIPAVVFDEMVNSLAKAQYLSDNGSDSTSASDAQDTPRHQSASLGPSSSQRHNTSPASSSTNTGSGSKKKGLFLPYGRNRKRSYSLVEKKRARSNSANSNVSSNSVSASQSKPNAPWASKFLKTLGIGRKRGTSLSTQKAPGPLVAVDDDADGANVPDPSYEKTTPDHAVRIQSDGRHVVTAATPEALLKLVLRGSYIDDDMLVADFFSTFRNFMKPSQVLEGICTLYESSAEKQPAALKLLANWSEPAPNHTDPGFPLDTTLHDEIIALLDKWEERGDTSPALADTRKNIHAAVESYRTHMSLPATHTPEIANLQVAVNFPDKSSVTLTVTVDKDKQLQHIRKHVANTLFPDLPVDTDFLGEQSYVCEALFFGVNLPEDVPLLPARLASIALDSAETRSNDPARWFQHDAIAELLTMIDFRCFARLDLYRLEQYATGVRQAEASNEELLPIMKQLTNRFNKVAEWICTCVLQLPTPDRRATMIEFFIETADKFYELYNFHGVLQILSALRNPAIKRLKHTWALVKPGKQAILETMHGIICPDDNRSAYRRKLASIGKQFHSKLFGTLSRKQCVSPCLPYIGFVLSDIVYFLDGNKRDTVLSYRARGFSRQDGPDDEMELINLFRYRGLTQIIEDIRIYQRTPYTAAQLTHATEDNVAYAEWFFNVFRGSDEDKSWALSLKLEPPMASHVPTTAETSDSATPASSSSTNPKPPATAKALASGRLRKKISELSSSSKSSCSTDVFEEVEASGPDGDDALLFIGSYRVSDVEAGTLSSDALAAIAHRSASASAVQTARHVRGAIIGRDVIFAHLHDGSACLKVDLDSIIHYNLDLEESLMFIATVVDGETLLHLFSAGYESGEHIYSAIHRAVQRAKRGTPTAYTAVAHHDDDAFLLDSQHADGAFVIRESTTMPGDYSFAFLHAGAVVRTLIEKLDTGVAFKDSPLVFSTLQELLAHHCVHQCELPCLLLPHSSKFSTSECTGITGFDLGSVDTQHEAILCRTSHSTAPWFFGDISAQEAEDILLDQESSPGLFLIRRTRQGHRTYALSYITSPNQPTHVAITEENHLFCLDGAPCAESLGELVRACSRPQQPWLETSLSAFPPRASRRDSAPPIPSRVSSSATLQEASRRSSAATATTTTSPTTATTTTTNRGEAAPATTSLLRTALGHGMRAKADVLPEPLTHLSNDSDSAPVHPNATTKAGVDNPAAVHHQPSAQRSPNTSSKRHNLVFMSSVI